MRITRTERYCAKQAYQLCLMRGLTQSTVAGKECLVSLRDNTVFVDGIGVPIAKAWLYL